MNALVAGSLLGALGVAAGAFGAHGLKARLTPDKLEVFEVGVRYHLLHALALLAVGLLARHLGHELRLPTHLMLWGTVVFSGSLYALALGAPSVLGAITPLGGVALIAGWVALAFAARGL
jgi:uncharacterized membrane protein YgdD (TMEM256/DUF423 family)